MARRRLYPIRASRSLILAALAVSCAAWAGSAAAEDDLRASFLEAANAIRAELAGLDESWRRMPENKDAPAAPKAEPLDGLKLGALYDAAVKMEADAFRKYQQMRGWLAAARATTTARAP